MLKTRLILDVNIWVSFAIGKQMLKVRDLVLQSNVEVLVCEQLLEEFKLTLQKPKLQKYISQERASLAFELIQQTAISINLKSNIRLVRDINDDYLLALAKDGKADFLLTGDNDLLILQQFENTRILTFSGYLSLQTTGALP